MNRVFKLYGWKRVNSKDFFQEANRYQSSELSIRNPQDFYLWDFEMTIFNIRQIFDMFDVHWCHFRICSHKFQIIVDEYECIRAEYYKIENEMGTRKIISNLFQIILLLHHLLSFYYWMKSTKWIYINLFNEEAYWKDLNVRSIRFFHYVTYF